MFKLIVATCTVFNHEVEDPPRDRIRRQAWLVGNPWPVHVVPPTQGHQSTTLEPMKGGEELDVERATSPLSWLRSPYESAEWTFD
jgi:hypothetical protein